jgi:hypothetical protein
MSENPIRHKSQYYDFLDGSEKCSYDVLQSNFTNPDHRYNRNHRLAKFQDMLDDLREFCEGPDAWRRYLACGVCWGSDFIATNTQQMRFILGKSKSSINGAFVKMGFDICSSKDCDNSELLTKIPFLKGRAQELRQWTIRKRDDCDARCSTALEFPRYTTYDEGPSISTIPFVLDDGFEFDRPFLFDRVPMEKSLPDTSLSEGEFRFVLDDGARFSHQQQAKSPHYPAM